IPLERMVLETDCPYLAPEPYRGKTNEPALMAFTAAETAKLIGVEPEELWTQCGKSAREFFGLEDLSG
ncbi:MAG: TatD family deoxyribonuclease, partial [Desulfovibrio sp.]